MESVRIGFVGTGSMGQCAHLANYLDIPGVEVAAIAEIRPELGKQVATRYGVPKVYTSHLDMLEAGSLDGLVASQQYRFHGSLLPELYRAGIPVLTEKPIARSVDVARDMLTALASSKATHYVGYHKRSDPATMHAVDTIRSFQQSDAIGPMRYLRITMPPGDWVANGFSHLIDSSEGYPELTGDLPAPDMSESVEREFDIFVNYYIHQVNLCRHLLGEDYSVTYAEDTGLLLVGKSDSGLPVTIEMAPYETSIDWQEIAVATFERGYVQLTLPAPLTNNRPGEVTIFTDPGKEAPIHPSIPHQPTTTKPQLPWVHAMRNQALNFVKAIRGENTPLCTASEALKDLEVARQYISLRHPGLGNESP